MGHVGCVLGTEMSRLARIGEGLVPADGVVCAGGYAAGRPDGVYDPVEYNDRLLLGLSAPA